MWKLDEISGEPNPATSNESADVGAIASSSYVPSRDDDPPSNSEGIAGRVSQFVSAHRPSLFCDDCIAEKLGLSHRRQANRVTVALGASSDFWRAVGACAACDKHKQVIRHV